MNWDAWVEKFGGAREPRFDVLFDNLFRGLEFDRADADPALAVRREVTALSDDFPVG